MAREQTTLSRFFTITEPPKKAARKESYQPTRKTLQNETEEPVRTNTLEDSPDHGGFARASNNSSAAVESASAEGTEQRQSGLSCVGVGEERVEEEGQARDETGGDVSPVQRTGELAEKLTTVEAGEGRPNVVEPGEGRPPYKLTPLESQVVEFKKKHKGVMLMFEVGYKMRFFGKDAEDAAEALGVMCFPDRNFLTASVPTVRTNHYIRRLVHVGYKVGVVGQAETAALKAQGPNKSGLFERKLTQLHTRATLEAAEGQHEGSFGPDNISSRLVCVAEDAPTSTSTSSSCSISIVAVDTSTGDVAHGHFQDGPMRSNLESSLLCLEPCEVLLAKPLSVATDRLVTAMLGQGGSGEGVRIERVNRRRLQEQGPVATLTQLFERHERSCESENAGSGESRMGAILALPQLSQQALAITADYLVQYGQERVLALGGEFRPLSGTGELSLSPNALRQLEVVQGSDGTPKGSLLGLVDQCKTPMGHRLMRHWITHPLKEPSCVRERLDAVEEAADASTSPLGSLPESLSRLPDVERGISRALHRTASPHELLSTLNAFISAAESLRPLVHSAGNEPQSPLLRRMLASCCSEELVGAAQSLLSALDEQAASKGDKTALFKDEARFPEVTEHRRRVSEAEKELRDLLPELAKRAGMRKLEYVTFQGTEYCIELPQDANFPASWPKISSNKQKRTVTCQPTEVSELVEKRDAARDKLAEAAHNAWQEFLADFADTYAVFRRCVQALATLDCVVALANLATLPGYVKPEIRSEDEPARIEIEEGRHPVLEAAMEGTFVPNSTELGVPGPTCEVITGPNMGGKSCYMRQVALIAIMAQAGCFVPAKSARIGCVDGVHTRMGAADSLALGASTFLEEMGEASMLAKRSTPRSLVVLDELGRGTSSLDGQALAEATLHYIAHSVGCLALFSTHYRAVASRCLSNASSCIRGRKATYSLGEDGSVAFLYKLANGVADRSFGLTVAKMAGLPDRVVHVAEQRAKEQQEVSETPPEASLARAILSATSSDKPLPGLLESHRSAKDVIASQE